MPAHSDLQACWQARWSTGLAIIAFTATATLGGCASPGRPSMAAASTASPAASPASTRDAEAAVASMRDSDMPDDMGKPLNPEQPSRDGARVLSIDMPISSIAAAPAGKAVLEHDLPGLCERPEFGMFKGMSLKALAGMSGGRINKAMLRQVQADLVKVSLTATTEH